MGAKKEALLSAVEGANAVKVENIKEEVKEPGGEAGVKLEAATPCTGEGEGGGGAGDLVTGPGSSPDGGATGQEGEGVKLDLKGKTDQAKIAELQKCVLKDNETIK